MVVIFTRSLLCLLLCLFASAIALVEHSTKNPLIWGEGNVQVTSEIDTYSLITPGVPIPGSVMVTHGVNEIVDKNSFRFGESKLEVEFVRDVQLSADNLLTISIFSFKLPGLPAGQHTLKPIQVKVNGKEYRALPMIVDVMPNTTSRK